MYIEGRLDDIKSDNNNNNERKKIKQDFIFEFHNNSTRFSRAKKKTTAGFLYYEHWIEFNDKDGDKITTCSGCNFSIRNSESMDASRCIIRTKKNNVWLLDKA